MSANNWISGKYSVAIWTWALFSLIGFAMWAIRDIRYFALFECIGTSELIARSIVIKHPSTRQLVRRLIQVFVGGMLLIMVSLIFCVNFQFIEIFFDYQAAVVTGAFIQLVIARLIIPFIFGNAFCSRACWDGAVFEAINGLAHCSKPTPRKPWLAWSYLLLLIIISIVIVHIATNPATDDALRRKWIIGENLFIWTVGFALSFVLGSRAYCRMLCPFLTISSQLYRFSFLKITPIKSADCINCNKCNKTCPMLIDVHKSVVKKSKIDNNTCILCERCVSACPKGVLDVTYKHAE